MFRYFRPKPSPNDVIRDLDMRLRPNITNVIVEYMGCGKYDFNVTRWLVLCFPDFQFIHVSVYHIKHRIKDVLFQIIADTSSGCYRFELVVDILLKPRCHSVTLADLEPHWDKHQRAQCVSNVVKRWSQHHGLFRNSDARCKLFVVACDGMGSRIDRFCPGFNLFCITNTLDVGHKIIGSDPARFVRHQRNAVLS